MDLQLQRNLDLEFSSVSLYFRGIYKLQLQIAEVAVVGFSPFQFGVCNFELVCEELFGLS